MEKRKIGDYLIQNAREIPDAPALYLSAEVSLNYRQLADNGLALAAQLTAGRVGRTPHCLAFAECCGRGGSFLCRNHGSSSCAAKSAADGSGINRVFTADGGRKSYYYAGVAAAYAGNSSSAAIIAFGCGCGEKIEF